jgi:hypothetical protein
MPEIPNYEKLGETLRQKVFRLAEALANKTKKAIITGAAIGGFIYSGIAPDGITHVTAAPGGGGGGGKKTPTPDLIATPTPGTDPTLNPTASPLITAQPTIQVPTPSNTVSPVITINPTFTEVIPTYTFTPSLTSSVTPSFTRTPNRPAQTRTSEALTATYIAENPSATSTETPTPTPTNSQTPTLTASTTSTETLTATATNTQTPEITNTQTSTIIPPEDPKATREYARTATAEAKETAKAEQKTQVAASKTARAGTPTPTETEQPTETKQPTYPIRTSTPNRTRTATSNPVSTEKSPTQLRTESPTPGAPGGYPTMTATSETATSNVNSFRSPNEAIYSSQGPKTTLRWNDLDSSEQKFIREAYRKRPGNRGGTGNFVRIIGDILNRRGVRTNLTPEQGDIGLPEMSYSPPADKKNEGFPNSSPYEEPKKI